MNFAQNLKILRKRQGETQADIALKFKLTPKSISFWENGEREPNFKTLCTLADYFGVTTDFLLGRTPPAPSKIKIDKIIRKSKA